MQQREGSKIRRIRLVSVGMEEPTKRRLDNYIQAQRPRPRQAELVSIAVQEYLDRAEQGEQR